MKNFYQVSSNGVEVVININQIAYCYYGQNLQDNSTLVCHRLVMSNGTHILFNKLLSREKELLEAIGLKL